MLRSVAIAAIVLSLSLSAQESGREAHRTRLYLKDGTYQAVLSYRVDGKNVVYRSSERAGQEEEIPLNLVDFDKTHAWENRHDANVAPVVDPELQRQEAESAAQVPEVAPNLRLTEGDSVLVLDYFQGTPDLVPLTQTQGDLNRRTAHNILRQTINPLAHAHQFVQLQGISAQAQLHVDTPIFFVRVDDAPVNAEDVTGSAVVVDTHGASSAKDIGHERASKDSRYVVVRTDVRQDVRVVSTFEMNLLGSGKMEEDAIQTKSELMPGGQWLKITPLAPLTFGEYALIEVINDQQLNLGVWDFGVHPRAKQNPDAVLPEVRRRPTLEMRPGVSSSPSLVPR